MDAGRAPTSPWRRTSIAITSRWRCLVVALCVLPWQAFASQPMVQRHYGTTDGLPVGSATSLAIDADGFLWVATHDGLARFDGREFQVYDSARFPQMGSNRVALLYRDRDKLYAQTDSLQWLQVTSQGIERIHPDPQDPESPIRFVHASPLCLTLNRGIFCASDDGFVPRRIFDPGLDIAAAVPDGKDDWLYALGRGVLLQRDGAPRVRWHDPQLVWNKQKPILADLAAPGRLRLTLPDGLIEVFADAPARWLQRNTGQALDIIQLRRENGRVLIGSDRGLFEIGDGAIDIARVTPNTAIAELSRSWRAPDGAFWHNIGGELFRDGVSVLRSEGVVTNMLFDADGRVWVNMLRDGVYALSPPRVDVIGVDPARPAPNVYGLAVAPDGSIWRGSLGDGLARLMPDGRIERAGAPVNQNPWAVAVAPDGGVYTAEVEFGLLHRAPGSDEFVEVPLPAALHDMRIHTIVFDPADRMWIGSTDGVWMRDGSTWTRQWPLHGRADVRAIALAGDVRWYGGSRGLWRVEAGRDTSVADDLLDGVDVRSLFIASDGALWVASSGRGLLRVAADDPHGVSALRLGRAEGMPSNTPHAMLEDVERNLWINSNQGIYRLTQTAIEQRLQSRDARIAPLRLGLADGLTDLEGNGLTQPAAAVDAQGRLLFASQRGVVRIDPRTLPLRRTSPQPVIDGVEFGEGRELADDVSELPQGVRSLQVRYNAPDLHAGSEVRFRYRLAPLDGAWTDADTRRVAPFTALAPGAYRFEVLAGNSDGAWSEVPTTRDFVIPPAWFETTAFRAALIVGSLLLVGALLHVQLMRLRRRAHRLDTLVHARTAELSAEKRRVETTLDALASAHDELAITHDDIAKRNLRLAEQATRLEALDRFRTRLLADVSHELRTPLMLVHLPLLELHDRATHFEASDQRRHDLALQQSERLSQLIEQLVRLVQAEAQQIALAMRRFDPEAFVRRVVDGFEPAAQRGDFTFELAVAPDLPALYGDPDHLQTVLGNLLDNASKYAPRHSRVRVTVGLADDDTLRIGVTDRGEGFPADQAAHLFERFYRGDGPPRAGRQGLGIGLALARELVELHGGRIGAERPADGGAGFWFTLPLGSAHVTLDELSLHATHTPLPPASCERGAPLPDNARAQRLLLVEDHPELALYLTERLSELWPVVCVPDAEAGWARLQQGDIAVLVSDVLLPGMSGIELCRRVKRDVDPARSSLPVILISAKAGDAARQDGLAAGASAWLAKPFGLPALRDTILSAWPAAAQHALDHTESAGTDDAGHIDAPLAEATTAPIDAVLQIAIDHLADPAFGIPQWAARVFVSDRQLRRRVVDLTGMPPVAWLREQRLLRVHALLSTGACRTLAEAGHKAGIDNPAYLYRLYRVRFADA